MQRKRKLSERNMQYFSPASTTFPHTFTTGTKSQLREQTKAYLFTNHQGRTISECVARPARCHQPRLRAPPLDARCNPPEVGRSGGANRAGCRMGIVVAPSLMKLWRLVMVKLAFPSVIFSVVFTGMAADNWAAERPAGWGGANAEGYVFEKDV